MPITTTLSSSADRSAARQRGQSSLGTGDYDRTSYTISDLPDLGLGLQIAGYHFPGWRLGATASGPN
jgi:hypothetical protein